MRLNSGGLLFWGFLTLNSFSLKHVCIYKKKLFFSGKRMDFIPIKTVFSSLFVVWPDENLGIYMPQGWCSRPRLPFGSRTMTGYFSWHASLALVPVPQRSQAEWQCGQRQVDVLLCQNELFWYIWMEIAWDSNSAIFSFSPRVLNFLSSFGTSKCQNVRFGFSLPLVSEPLRRCADLLPCITQARQIGCASRSSETDSISPGSWLLLGELFPHQPGNRLLFTCLVKADALHSSSLPRAAHQCLV